jgi:hypothetical protein
MIANRYHRYLLETLFHLFLPHLHHRRHLLAHYLSRLCRRYFLVHQFQSQR